MPFADSTHCSNTGHKVARLVIMDFHAGCSLRLCARKDCHKVATRSGPLVIWSYTGYKARLLYSWVHIEEGLSCFSSPPRPTSNPSACLSFQDYIASGEVKIKPIVYQRYAPNLDPGRRPDSLDQQCCSPASSLIRYASILEVPGSKPFCTRS